MIPVCSKWADHAPCFGMASLPPIQIVDEGWDTSPGFVAIVIASTRDPFSQAFAVEPQIPGLVVARHDGPPRVLHRDPRLEDRIQVRLNARGTDPGWIMFQFAHELGHVITNYDKMPPERFQWLDECFCEVASLYALQEVSRTWLNDSDADPTWIHNGNCLAIYAQQRISLPEHTLPSDIPFLPWLETKLPELERDCGGSRVTNTIIAKQLLPVFRADPSAWCAMRRMNTWNFNEQMTLDDYFDAWEMAAGEYGHFVRTFRTILLGAPMSA
jgi:hypothetical protein